MSEPDVTQLMTVQQAIAILDASVVTPRTHKVKLASANGFYLAEDILADRDYPPFQKSLMDGFAIRNTGDSLSELHLFGEIRAGQSSAIALSPGQAMSIMTGAPLPAGADAVVPIEFAQRVGDRLRITQPGDFKRFVATRGSDCIAGDIVLKRGSQMRAAHLAAAATVGAHQVEVYEPPRVAILATGDELVSVDASPIERCQIRNSNTPMLASLLSAYGCSVTDLGVIKDDMPAIVSAIHAGLEFDALFITGGMSVGAYDLPPRALEQLDITPLITKLKIKPGKPFIYARHGATERACHIFGLPGNPLAGFVCTVRLASRVLRRMMGAPVDHLELTATLVSALPANGPREFYQPAQLIRGMAHPLNWKGSADVFTLAQATALLVRDENEPAQPAGATCRLIAI